MQWCADKGRPHSWLLGWDPMDRAKLIAFLVESNARCPMCGTAPWEWEENKFAYTPVDDFCQGCYQKSVFGDQEGSRLPGTNVKLVPTNKMMTAQTKVKAMRRQRQIRAAKAEAEAEGGRGDSSGERSPDSGHLRLQPKHRPKRTADGPVQQGPGRPSP